jgi:ketosteroid isomerase-like protein
MQSSRTLSEDQQNKIRNEIQTVITQIRDAAANVDSTKLYNAFDFADKDFTCFDIDGTPYDQSAYRQMVHEFYGPLQSEIIAEGKERFTYLSEDNVLWNYSGALTATFKNGKKATYDPFAMTMLFKKINGKWKVVFLQESTQEPSDMTKH